MSAPKIDKAIHRAAAEEAARHDCAVTFNPGGKHPFIMHVTRRGQTRSVAVSLKLIRSEFNEQWIKRDIRRLAGQLR